MALLSAREHVSESPFTMFLTHHKYRAETNYLLSIITTTLSERPSIF